MHDYAVMIAQSRMYESLLHDMDEEIISTVSATINTSSNLPMTGQACVWVPTRTLAWAWWSTEAVHTAEARQPHIFVSTWTRCKLGWSIFVIWASMACQPMVCMPTWTICYSTWDSTYTSTIGRLPTKGILDHSYFCCNPFHHTLDICIRHVWNIFKDYVIRLRSSKMLMFGCWDEIIWGWWWWCCTLSHLPLILHNDCTAATSHDSACHEEYKLLGNWRHCLEYFFLNYSYECCVDVFCLLRCLCWIEIVFMRYYVHSSWLEITHCPLVLCRPDEYVEMYQYVYHCVQSCGFVDWMMKLWPVVGHRTTRLLLLLFNQSQNFFASSWKFLHEIVTVYFVVCVNETVIGKSVL